MKKTLMLSLALTLLVVGAPYLLAADGQAEQEQMQHEEHHGMEAEGGSDDMKMEQMHEQMMERHQKMLEQMKQNKAELDQLVQQMQSAEGDAKVDAVAAVVQELVSQHQHQMDRRLKMMEKMDEGGMGMMMHGKAGMHHGGMKGHHGMKGDCPHGGDCPHAGDCPMGEDCPMHEKMHGESGDEGQQ